MINLYQFPPQDTFPSFSPYCLKVETYLKAAKIEYKNIYGFDNSKNPRAQMPFIELADGEIIADSHFIIDYLSKHKVDLNANLSTADKAIANAFQCLVENRLFLLIIYYRWVDKSGFETFMNYFAKTGMPAHMLEILKEKSHKIAESMHVNGTSRYSEEERHHLINEYCSSISDYLAEKPFMLGNTISKIDITIFSILGAVIFMPLDKVVKSIVVKYPNLVKHSTIISHTDFPEFVRGFF
jgi:glutathione S-transferase